MDTQNLFSYGTLQIEAVQLATFGRRLKGEADTLLGYRLATLRMEDEDHRNLQFTGNPSDSVEGTAFEVTENELEQADAYEPDGYERVRVTLKSGLQAWVYLNSQQ